MSRQRIGQAAVLGVVRVDVPIVAAGVERLSVGAEAERTHRHGVAREGVEELARAHVEEGDGAVHGTAREPATVGTVRHALW